MHVTSESIVETQFFMTSYVPEHFTTKAREGSFFQIKISLIEVPTIAVADAVPETHRFARPLLHALLACLRIREAEPGNRLLFPPRE